MHLFDGKSNQRADQVVNHHWRQGQEMNPKECYPIIMNHQEALDDGRRHITITCWQ